MSGLRITGGAPPSRAIALYVDDVRIEAQEGDTLAVALLVAGLRTLRRSPSGMPRGLFCGMGVCQECVVLCDGRKVTACSEPARDGMRLTIADVRSPGDER